MAAVLAALSAVTFGIGDFFGGLSARRIVAQLTTLAAQATGLVLLVVVASTLITGEASSGDWVVGAAAGVCGGIGLILFYWAMAQGPMSVVAPVSAVMSALVPVLAGVLGGERPAVRATIGIVAALPAIVLISREPTRDEVVAAEVHAGAAAPRLPAGLAAVGGLPLVAATLAGVGFGLFFTLLSTTSEDSGLWPIVSARAAAVVLALVVVGVARPRHAGRDGLLLAMAAGCLDATANSLYLLASRQGLLSVVGAIGAMYPASTVILARLVLGERLARHQLVGLAVAAGAVALIATG
jgi:uncharacterized membrane protein